MGTEMGSLSTALSALQSERKALQVTGQNIANANTAGYTRQRANLQAVGGSVQPAMYATSDGIGGGVTITDIQRLQDSFLEQRANTENGTLSSLQGTQETLADIENSFGEPGDTGLQSLLSTYWNGWDDVANNANDPGARTSLIGDAQSLAAGLNGAATALSSQWASTSQTLATTVGQVNELANNVASLNKAIISATGAGNSPNDLMDQRDTLIRQLATMVGVTTKAHEDGSTDVLIGGSSLVSGTLARQLTVGGATALDQASTTPVTLTWSDSGTAVPVSGGQVGSMLTALNTTILWYRTQLDGVASTLASNANTHQAAGFDLSGNAGVAFFGPTDPLTPVTAANISVVITDPKTVAASSIAPTTDSSGNPVPNLDGSNAQAMGNLASDPASAGAMYRKMIVQLGSQSQTAQQKVNTQQGVVQQVETSRDSASGVDLDEEQTNLVSFQQAYNAAAQYLMVINSVLDTLINKTLV